MAALPTTGRAPFAGRSTASAVKVFRTPSASPANQAVRYASTTPRTFAASSLVKPVHSVEADHACADASIAEAVKSAIGAALIGSPRDSKLEHLRRPRGKKR